MLPQIFELLTLWLYILPEIVIYFILNIANKNVVKIQKLVDIA